MRAQAAWGRSGRAAAALALLLAAAAQLSCGTQAVSLFGGGARKELAAKQRGHAAEQRHAGAAGGLGGAAAGVQAVDDEATKSPAGIQVAARQSLFDYGTAVVLGILRERVTGLRAPDVSKTFNVPVVGGFELQLSNIAVANFSISSTNAKLTILNGFFHLEADGIEAGLTFSWHWSKAGLSGSGDGELRLHGGAIDYLFDIQTDEDLKKPQLTVVASISEFDSVELKIHSFKADWLYQAVLSLFNDAVKRQVQNGISSALANDVPKKLNQVLASLPTHIDVKGLPFSTTFDYSIYTLAFVLVKGFGEVDINSPDNAAAPGSVQSSQDMLRCPFDTSPLPLPGHAIGDDPAMVSIYLHESTANCLLWGLYRTGRLAFTLKDGTIKGLTITTDLLAMLVPQLPMMYPHQLLRFDVTALDNPQVSFSAASGTTISAYYRLSLVVQNATLGDPEVVRLAANLTVTGMFGWDSISVTDVQVHHEVESSAVPVPPEQWDNTVSWALMTYAPMGSIRQLVQLAVHTPAASMVKLKGAKVENMDHWYALSSDVDVTLPPAPAKDKAATTATS